MHLEAKGFFWLPGLPETETAGVLTFRRQEGPSLELIGSLFDISSAATESEEKLRVVGLVGNRSVTLENCICTHSSFNLTGGTATQTFRPAFILRGIEFERDEDIEFSSIAFQTTHMAHWVGRTGISIEWTDSDDSAKQPRKLGVIHTPLERTAIPCAGGTLELGFSWGLAGDHVVSSTIEQEPYFRFTPAEPSPIRDLLTVCATVQNLVTFATDKVSPITSISFQHSAVVRTLTSGTVVHDEIDFYAEQQGSNHSVDEKRLHVTDMLLTFDGLGGLEAVGRWIEVGRQYEPVIGALFAQRYAAHMFMENRLQNVVYAAETFHRLRFPNFIRPVDEYKGFVKSLVRLVPKEHRDWLSSQLQYSNEPRLKARLLDLIEYAGEPFVELVGDPSAWAESLKSARNRSVHRDDDADGDVESIGTSLYFLSEAAHFLVAMCLLREAGVSTESLGRLHQHRRFKWLAEWIQPDGTTQLG